MDNNFTTKPNTGPESNDIVSIISNEIKAQVEAKYDKMLEECLEAFRQNMIRDKNSVVQSVLDSLEIEILNRMDPVVPEINIVIKLNR